MSAIPKFRTVRAYRYHNCNIYIRTYDEMCEYIVVIKGEVYTAHLHVRKTFLQKILRRDYTEQQLEGIAKYLSKMAETTVDTVLDKKK